MRRLIATANPGTGAQSQAEIDQRRALEELQRAPFAQAVVVEDVSLADGVETPVAHGLGRVPVFVSPSAPRGPSSTGRIEEIRSTSGTLDRRKFVVLKASGWGATITVNVVVA